MVMLSIVAVLAVWAAFRGVDYYVRRSLRSFEHASQVWNTANDLAQDVLAAKVPLSVARLVLELSALAGCGCFVRGMIVSHYLPRLHSSRSNEKGPWDQAFADLETLEPDVRQTFSKYIGMLILYDSFRNPFQGWLFRRAMRSVTRPNPSYEVRMETQLTAYSVVSKRSSNERIARSKFLQTA